MASACIGLHPDATLGLVSIPVMNSDLVGLIKLPCYSFAGDRKFAGTAKVTIVHTDLDTV